MEIAITDHARFEAQRRHVGLDLVMHVVQNPQQIITSKKSRIIYQSKYYDTIEDKEMLLRVIAEHSGNMTKVISLYKTSKIDKYWIVGK